MMVLRSNGVSADCTWDYFTCTNKYGSWPANKDCCDQRFTQCCMQVMTPPPATSSPQTGGYGPPEPEIDIDIENDLNIPDLENPIDDIDLGDGQSIQRPDGRRISELCSESNTGLLAHASDCSKYLACQPGPNSSWMLTTRSCSPGTVFDSTTGQCDFRRNVKSCQEGGVFFVNDCLVLERLCFMLHYISIFLKICR